MENKRKRTVKTFLLAGMAVCLILIGRAYYHSVQHRVQQENLRKMVTEASVQYPVQADSAPQEVEVSVLSGAEATGRENRQEGNDSVMLAGYAGLYEENKDFAGWLSIEGMRIDYPVMQTEDDTYYLHHDFYGEDSKYGCLYVKGQADLDAGTNFIIYGHNMKDGSMFGDLDLYLKESFFREHPVISFDTLYEERTYDIIAVFRSQVYNVDDEVFKYYQFYQADTQEEFEYFYDNIKELSLYDTGVEAKFGDTFLTLSTCAYHVPDGRLVVVAKRRE
ncbi:MAG: class B sortase [Muribaculum sp.]|nr:class B sortase [Ruminococcus flavefaciens]MCM1376404.1 class B sortase [Muribaculum sp.]